MNKNQAKITEDLIKLAQAIQVLYIKLYNLEIENKKSSLEYKETLEMLKMAIDTEEKEYQKNIGNKKLIDSIINYLNYCLPKLKMKDSIFDKNMPLVRVYSHLQDLIYSFEYQVKNYKQEDIDKIERYTDFKDFINDRLSKLYCEQVIKKQRLFGILNKFAYITRFNNFQTKEVIEKKYYDAYNFGFIESSLVNNNFNIKNISYPIALEYADYLMVNKDECKEIKDNCNLSDVASKMMDLLTGGKEKMLYLYNKAYFLYLIELLSVENLYALEELFYKTIYNPLNGYKFNSKRVQMIAKIIEKTYNMKAKQYILIKTDL